MSADNCISFELCGSIMISSLLVIGERNFFLVKLIYWTEHIVKRSFTAQCTDDFLHGPYKNQLVLDLNTKCGSELLYVRCELAKFATTIISIIFFPSHFCEQKNYFHHHIIYYFIMRHIKETSFLSQHIHRAFAKYQRLSTSQKIS